MKSIAQNAWYGPGQLVRTQLTRTGSRNGDQMGSLNGCAALGGDAAVSAGAATAGAVAVLGAAVTAATATSVVNAPASDIRVAATAIKASGTMRRGPRETAEWVIVPP